MIFNSYIFILLFLPVCIVGYFSINRLEKYDLAQLFLLGMSIWFYGYLNIAYLSVIVGSIVFNYLIYLALNKQRKKSILFLGVSVNVCALIYFKYMDFFIENINYIWGKEFELLRIALPLGISFFTFQQLSFIVDAYRGEIPRYNLLYYASYVVFFPLVSAGPIVRHHELIPQFMDDNRKYVNWDNVAKGLYIFALGLAKKVLLADAFGRAVVWGYANMAALDSTNAILVMLGYTFQIYFDFSGYSDMAIGIGKMLNIDLPLNFNSPYKAVTITEFWDRWHISLTRFFTKYVYIPLGGNRKGSLRTYINILIVFLISGFWHGASWNFVLWGLCHGLFSVLTRRFKRVFHEMHPALNWMITFGFVNVMWVFFRADTIAQAFELLKKITMLGFGEINESLLACFRLPEITVILSHTSLEASCHYFMLALFYIGALLLVLGAKNPYEKMQAFRNSIFKVCTTALLMVWCIFSLSGISTFLYFNF